LNLSFRGLLAALLGALALAACQPSLKSELPIGPAAYQSINATTQPAAQTGPYLLRPGDRISVSVYQEQELNQPEITIDEAGMISLPLVGEVKAAGRSTGDLAAQIQQAYGQRYLRDPQVNVALKEARARTYSVEGEVAKPGQFVFEPGNTLLTAVAVAGSPLREAKLDEVLVFRNVNGQRMGGRFDLTAIRAGREPDPQILPGDVIVVGFSSLRGAYRDILQAAPLLGLFTVF
jgi:polysaccharide export outer membrane protein